MKETFTYDDVVQFMYREMPASEAGAMSHLLETDEDMKAMYEDLLVAKNQLPKVLFNPPSSVLNAILQYSTKTALEAQC